jgi:hypothetical protein
MRRFLEAQRADLSYMDFRISETFSEGGDLTNVQFSILNVQSRDKASERQFRFLD